MSNNPKEAVEQNCLQNDLLHPEIRFQENSKQKNPNPKSYSYLLTQKDRGRLVFLISKQKEKNPKNLIFPNLSTFHIING